MEKGEKVYIKIKNIHKDKECKYQEGEIEGVYTHHILVRFKYSNGNSYLESFFKHEIAKKEELEEDASIY